MYYDTVSAYCIWKSKFQLNPCLMDLMWGNFWRQNYVRFFYCIQQPALRYISAKTRLRYLLTNSPPSTWLTVLKHRRLVCELICFLTINTHLPWRCNHRLMRNAQLAFKRKIKSVVKIDLCIIQKLTGTNFPRYL